MSNQDSTIDLGGYGAIPPSYGTDTITLNPSWPTMATSITTPSTYTIGANGSNYYNFTATATATSTSSGTVNISATGIDMAAGTDIKIDGKSLNDFMNKLEERLSILHPNPELESRWDKLKDLRKQYIEMEKDILEKEKIMKILKEA